MGQLALTKALQTMTSREIAELTGKEHRHVFRDAQVMFTDLGINPVDRGYAQIWTHPQNGQIYNEYALPKDLTLTLVSGYSTILRKRIIDRWLELEAAQTPAIPTSYAAALRLAAAQAEQLEIERTQNIALQTKVRSDAPKVEFAENIRAMDGIYKVGAVAQSLGIGQNTLFKMMREHGILQAGSNKNRPYQKYVDRGYFKVNAGEPVKRGDGSFMPTWVTMVTGAGYVYLQRKFKPGTLPGQPSSA